jgi:hypothetical protein
MLPEQQMVGTGQNRVGGAGDAVGQPDGDRWWDDPVRAAVDDLGRGRNLGQPGCQLVQLDQQGALFDHEGAPHGRPGAGAGQSGEYVQRFPGAAFEASPGDGAHPVAGEHPSGDTQGQRRQHLTDEGRGEQTVLPAEPLTGSDGGRQHQAGSPLGKEPGEGEGHPSAPAVTDEQRSLHAEAVEQVSQRHRIPGETRGLACGAPVAWPVGDDRREVVADQRDNLPPVEGRARLAVQEHDRRATPVLVRTHRPARSGRRCDPVASPGPRQATGCREGGQLRSCRTHRSRSHS